MGTGRPRAAVLVTYLLHSQRFDIRLLGSDDLSIAEPFREHWCVDTQETSTQRQAGIALLQHRKETWVHATHDYRQQRIGQGMESRWELQQALTNCLETIPMIVCSSCILEKWFVLLESILSIHLLIRLSIHPFIRPSIQQSIHRASIHPSPIQTLCLSIHPAIFSSIHLSIHPGSLQGMTEERPCIHLSISPWPLGQNSSVCVFWSCM